MSSTWMIAGAAVAVVLVAVLVVRVRKRRASTPPPFDPLEWRRGGCGSSAPGEPPVLD